MESDDGLVVVIREFDAEKDCLAVEEAERRCEVGPSGKMSLFTDLLGDPICRVRHSPAFLMLVAETGPEKEIVGLIRGCIKTVTRGKKHTKHGKNDNDATKPIPASTKLAYILGLRVSPSHRRKGIGFKLVSTMENWFTQNGARYSYMATDSDNEASVKLFTDRCGYAKFRTPSILVQPVFAHRVKISKRVNIFRLTPSEAETLYRTRFSSTEFFPRDIDAVLNNKLNLGTFVAVPTCGYCSQDKWPGADTFLADPPLSWAVISVWNSKDVFKLEVRGVSRVRRGLAKATRMVDRTFPWLRIPSFPEVFRSFGLHFMYGLGGNGPDAVKLMKSLCGFAHNLAKEHGCSVLATEVSSCEPLKSGIPHWKKLCTEDLWCMKRLREEYNGGSRRDWTKSQPGLSIFVDPREI